MQPCELSRKFRLLPDGPMLLDTRSVIPLD